MLPVSPPTRDLAMKGNLMKYAVRVALVFASLCFFASAAIPQATSAVAGQQAAPSAVHPVTCRASFGPSLGMAVSRSTAPYSGE